MGNEQSAASAPLQAAADSCEVSCDSLPGNGPSERETAGAFFSRGGTGALVVFGGHGTDEQGADQAHNDVWVLPSGAGWQLCNPDGRAARARSGHTVSSVPDVGLVVFGGLCHEKGYLSDVTLLAPTPDGSLAWTPVCVTGELPTGRDKHSAVVVPAGASAAGSRLLCYGGFGVMPPSDEEEDDEDDDDEADGAAAGNDDGADAAGEGEGDDAAGAGEDAAGAGEAGEGGSEGEPRGPSVDLGWFGDVHELDVGTWRWRKLVTQPSATTATTTSSSAAPAARAPAARAAHACCALALGGDGGDCMLLFGGRTAAGRVNDTWLFDAAAQTWTAPSLSGAPAGGAGPLPNA